MMSMGKRLKQQTESNDMTVKRILLATAISFTGTAAMACANYDSVVAAVETGDTTRASDLYEEIAIDPECGDELREWVGDYLARESFVFAVSEAGNPNEKRDALERALGYERHWRTFNELGRMDWLEKNYSGASQNFQAAIGELVEGDPDHAAEPDEIAALYDMAAASVALAGDAEIPVTRSGEPGGIFSTKIRGFEVVEIPVPITFEFDSAEFDEQGRKIATALADHVQAASPEEITLVGHTDPRGTDEYNLALSVDRANAVREFLAAQGFEGTVQIEGRGETEIPAPPPGIEEGSEEHFRIARRVAFSSQ